MRIYLEIKFYNMNKLLDFIKMEFKDLFGLIKPAPKLLALYYTRF